MSQIEVLYGLYKEGYVHEDGSVTDSQRITSCGDLDEIYRFQARHNYVGEEYYICEVEFDGVYYTQIENSRID